MDRLDEQGMRTLLEAVGAHLEADGVEVPIVVVGGAALALHGWVRRTTQDVDVIAIARGPDASPRLEPPVLPEALLRAVARVARDFGLSPNWLNSTVGAQWRTGLPDGIEADLEWHRFRALHVALPGRRTLIALKLFAAVDRGIRSVHVQDLLALRPSEAELASAKQWVLGQDIAPEWPALVDEVCRHVRERREHR